MILLLRDFGFESLDLSKEDFVVPDQIVQLGVEPNRIDLLTGISGVDFDEAFKRKIVVELEGEPLNFISSEDLIRNKLATGRDQDLVDVKAIQSQEKKE